MGKIITINILEDEVSALKNKKLSTVLVGGCFDILHVGHIKFLEEAKKHGDILIVLLESDEKVNNLKGLNKPVFSQTERAKVLSAVNSVDLIIILPDIKSDTQYDELIRKIHPDIIAITQNDPYTLKKKKQAEDIKGKLVAIPYVKTYSSSKLATIVGIE